MFVRSQIRMMMMMTTRREIGSTELYLRLTPRQRERERGKKEKETEHKKSSETRNGYGILSKMDD